MFMLAALIVLVALAYGDFSDDALGHALDDPLELLKMYDEFRKENHRPVKLGSSADDSGMRIKEFRKHVQGIYNHNKQDSSWKEGVNEFADMTDSERCHHLGLNVTNVVTNVEKTFKLNRALSVPDRKSWISTGYVTTVKNQGACGSCWAFGALGTLEGVYKLESKVLRQFSEQQLLDCTYEQADGCGGGWMRDGILGIRDTSDNKLASEVDYPYEEYDGSCRQKANSMVGARVSGYVELESGEQHTIAALAERPLTVTFHVLDSFFSYTAGIYRDNTATSFPNHALTAVAYTPAYVLVKNSWGQSWGDRGFVKIARNYKGCSFHTFVGYAVVEQSDTPDTNDSDPVTDYTPGDDDDDGDDGDCVDDPYFSGCRRLFCIYGLIREVCPKTCNNCDDGDAGDCPSGTVRCKDGVCRHEHMC